MKKTFTILIAAIAAILMMAQPVKVMGQRTITYEQLTSIANIDESAQYVLGIDGTGFHYEGTSSWGKTALPSAQTPIYYTLKKATDGKSFTAKTTISSTTYYLQIPTSNTFSMETSTGTNTDIIIGTTQVSGTNYAVANKTTTGRHLRINGTSGLRSYAGTTGTMAFFYKVVDSGGGGTPTCVAPQFTPTAGTHTVPQSVIISSTTEGATIYYTTDGNDPTTSSSVYSTAIPVTSTTTIKAMAVKENYNNSSVSTATYTINITYSALPFEWDSSSTPTGVKNSGVGTYNTSPYLKFDTQGDYIILPISGTPAVLYYDIKGNSLSGTYKFTVLESANGIDYTTLKEYTSIAGFTTTETLTPASTTRFIKWIYTTKANGNVALGNIKVYAQAKTPTFSPTGGAFYEAQDVTISSDTEGASIYYTLDGSTPTTSSTLYSTAIAVSSTTTIKAIATKDKMVDSEVAIATYTIHTTDASISVSPTSIESKSAGATGTLNVSYENITDVVADVYFCDDNGDSETYDWIDAEIDDDNNVYYVVSANKSGSRTAYFKVYALDDDENLVYSNLVTVHQAAYVDPATQYILFSGELVEGDYLIVSGGVAMNNTVSDKNRIQYTSVSAINNVIATTESTIVWHIAKNGDYWTIQNAYSNNYAASTSIKNEATLVSEISDNARWTVTGTETYNFANKARAAGSDSDNKWLQRNSTYGFACYKSADGPLSLYRKNDVITSLSEEDELTANATIPSGGYALYDNITIPAGESKVLRVYGTLKIVGTLTNNDVSHLIIEDGGQLIVPNNAEVAATFRKEMPAAPADKDDVTVTGWKLISSPTNTNNDGTNEDFSAVTNLEDANGYLLYKYDENNRLWVSSQGSSSYNTLNVAQGYLYGNNSGKAIEFTGNVNSAASYSIDLSYNEKDSDNLAGFNLIGNPFSHDIYKGVGGAINDSKLAEGFYIENGTKWTAMLGYETPIKPGQGILVKTTEEFKLTINNTTANATADKANHDNIMFKVENSECSDVTYALFDKGYGLNKISHRGDMVPMLYIPQNGENYAIAMMDDNTNSFNLNFEAKTIGKYTLSFKANGEFNYLHVIDRMTGEDIDMLLEGEYSFVGSPQDSKERFIVRLGYLPNYDDNGEDIFAYQNGSDIVVSGEGELQIFDVMGRKVASININGVETVNIPAQGVYIMKLNEKTQKIVVR